MPQIAAPSHFTQLRDWSARKHAILEAYLPAFCTALSRQVRGGAIWYVDGFAGAGVYRDPSDPSDPGVCGSPVLAARITADLPYPIRCLNVEEHDENFASLERETASFPHVTNMHSDFNTVVAEVLKTVGRNAAFFFLDPFGTKALPMDGLVDRIAQRTDPTDILLRYDTSAVRRLAANYEKDPVRGGANALNLDKWFRGQGWRKLVEQHAGEARDEALIHHYLEQLVSISGGRLRHACSYPIRTTEGTTKYHLVFATGNRLGMKLMSDILFRAEAQYEQDVAAYQEAKSNGQMDLFADLAPTPEDIARRRVVQLSDSILELARRGKAAWEFEDLRYALFSDGWFARFSEKDLRAACKGLFEAGKIERVSTGKAWGRGTQFIVRP
jgi:three-Cys-motif partner protein